ncbi:MAG: rod shape-determining protein MreC [Deltaproteobacteria bacterium]|nr:rod shape-determining protein MreC [Deltaproteobacteria bacterium]
MFQFLGKNRIYLTAAVLLGAAALLLSSSIQRETRFSFIDRLIFDLAVPIQKMVAVPAQTVREVWGDYVALMGVSEENKELRRRISDLAEENRQFREALLTAERYRLIGEMRDRLPQPMIPASVIGEDSTAWFRTVLLDRGERDGVKRGMAVVTAEGVVGHVVAASSRAAKVLLVIDTTSAVDVMVERSRARGIVEGERDSLCALKYMVHGDDVKVGDRLVSSGMGGFFPKGLPVGKVTEIATEKRGLFQQAIVQPSVDFNKLEEVFVILELSPQQKLLEELAPPLG